MPNSHPDEQPVTWGRWAAEREALDDRIGVLERFSEQRRGLEAELRALDQRTTTLERTVGGWQERAETERTEHRTRTWQVALAVVTGLVLPLATLGIVALLHLGSG